MDSKYVIGVDIGSTNIKTLVVSLDGRIISQASEEVREINKKGGVVEQDPEEIWSKFKLCMGRMLKRNNIVTDNILGIGMDSNRCSLMLLDSDCHPLTSFITWRDTRATQYVDRFYKSFKGINIYSISGEQGRPQHSIFKIMWFKENMPHIWKECRFLMFSPKDYILYKLLNKRITSMSMAQSTGLFNISTLQWEQTLLEIMEIHRDMLPETLESNEYAGFLSNELAIELGLCRQIPVIAGMCDATASQVGIGAVETGKFSLSIGTCGAIRTFSSEPVISDNEFVQIRCLPPYGYIPSCTISDAGSVLKWYRNNFCIHKTMQAEKGKRDCYDILDDDASAINPGSDGLILLPNFTGGSYAYGDVNLSGVFFGIKNHHSHAHFTRAILEGVGYSFRYVLEKFKANDYKINEIRIGGGGAKSKLWKQIISDICNLPILTVECNEASAMGAAIMAAIGTGAYETLAEAVENMVKTSEVFVPDEVNSDIYEKYYCLYKELNTVLKEFYTLHGQVVHGTNY